jgi:hypothetical protein
VPIRLTYRRGDTTLNSGSPAWQYHVDIYQRDHRTPTRGVGTMPRTQYLPTALLCVGCYVSAARAGSQVHRQLQGTEMWETFGAENASMHSHIVYTPEILASMENYLSRPIEAIASSMVAHEMGNLPDEEEERKWLYTQILTIREIDVNSSVTMVYLGQADSRFVGYYDDTSYTVRHSGTGLGSEATLNDYVRAPFTLHLCRCILSSF